MARRAVTGPRQVATTSVPVDDLQGARPMVAKVPSLVGTFPTSTKPPRSTPSAVLRPSSLLVKSVGVPGGAIGPRGASRMIEVPVPWRFLPSLKLVTSTSPAAEDASPRESARHERHAVRIQITARGYGRGVDLAAGKGSSDGNDRKPQQKAQHGSGQSARGPRGTLLFS